MDLNEDHIQLMKQYSRSIVHMRSQIQSNRFGLVFGSGLSRSFGLPKWLELVEKIAEDPEVDGKSLLEMASDSKSLPYQAELLLQRYRKKQSKIIDPERIGIREFEYRTLGGWKRLVAKHLYAEAQTNFEEGIDKHPYLKQYLKIINKIPVTVTYNFDDCIEQALLTIRTAEQVKESRGYEMVTNPWTQFKRSKAVIYHPNGVYPQKLMELPIDQFVFTESTFAEQFIGFFAGDQTWLLNHFSKNTCLLIGLSLEDEMLRHLLILSGKYNPGNYHYYVHFLDDDDDIDEEQSYAIFHTNFNVYNLITLFLKNSDIAALGEIINRDFINDSDFTDQAQENSVKCCYNFYITGALGVGKSTTASQFRNLIVYDEWLEPRPHVLSKPWKKLNDNERHQADEWILRQFKLKNNILRKQAIGISLVDRPPMDPLSFTPKDEISDKAKNLLRTLCPNNTDWKVQEGVIILLSNDSKELMIRLSLTGRIEYTKKDINEMDQMLKKVYNCDGVIRINTHGMNISEVAKHVAKIIHINEYTPCNIHERLENFRDGKIYLDAK